MTKVEQQAAGPTWRPRLRDSIIVQRDGSEALFIFTADRLVKRFAVDDLVLHMLPLLDGTRTVADLRRELRAEAAEPNRQLMDALSTMRDERILSKSDEATALTLGTERHRHYDRQLRFFQDLCDEGRAADDLGVELQERLDRATVLVSGVGGLGCWVVQALAAMGVGTLRLCDGDRVEASNLTRQVLFAREDIGRPKVAVAADRVRAMNPDVTVEATQRTIHHEADLADLVSGADLVVNCADMPSLIEISGWVSQACWPTVPHILGGGYAYHVGILGTTVIPGETACWECVRQETFTDHGRDRAETLIARRERAGTLAPLAGLIGNALAWEAVRVLTGMPTALTDVWAELDFWPLQVRTRAVPRRPGCPRCGAGVSGSR